MSDFDRGALIRRGMLLNYATIGYNSLEAIASLIAGLLAGSVALVGFGVDSVIEVTASGAAQWRLRSDVDPVRRVRAERISLRVIGACFLGLAADVAALAIVPIIVPEGITGLRANADADDCC